MKVCFLNPGDDADSFFGTMVSYMRRAASSFGIELEVVDSHRDNAVMRSKARAVVSRPTPPEYLLLVNEQGLAVEILPLASERGIKTLLLNEGLMVPDRHALGSPGERHANWLGELVPDDRRGGYLLADSLIAAARRDVRRRRDGRILMCGLGGSFTSSSLLRINGLRQAIAENTDVSLVEVVAANWDKERARTEAARLLAANPELAVIWAASDEMALGASEAVIAAGGTLGTDVVLGGIDWAPFAFDTVRKGNFAASVGGHFLDGAWALILLYDRHHRPERGAIEEKSQLALMTRANVDAYERVFSRHQAIDFTRFSKVKNPELTRYSFSIDTVL